jgi:hypothetical protein
MPGLGIRSLKIGDLNIAASTCLAIAPTEAMVLQHPNLKTGCFIDFQGMLCPLVLKKKLVKQSLQK